MGRRFPNPRAVKTHRNYSVRDIARTFGVHEKTVRAWLSSGLSAVDEARPVLVTGLELRRFLEHRRRSAKRPCQRDQLYCLRCKVPREPFERRVDVLSLKAGQLTISGQCPACKVRMFRHVRNTDLHLISAKLDVRLSDAERHLNGGSFPSSNTPFSEEQTTDAMPPPQK
jgi:transposase-like protein